MIGIESISAALAQSLRRGAPTVHPLDDAPGTVHLGAFTRGELVGAVSGFAVDPAGRPNPGWLQVWGPFGRGATSLVRALGERAEVWADSERPGLRAPRDGVWGPGGWAIEVIEGFAAVRARPGMYVGDDGLYGMRTLVRTVVDEVVAEHVAGHAHALRVDFDATAITVADDGRGIPPELALLSHSLHEVGLAAVCALSSALILVADREGRRYHQVFVRGEPLTERDDLGPSTGRGTTIRFVPDPAIFGARQLVADDVRAELAELAVLHPGLRIALDGAPLPSHGGLPGFATRLADSDRPPLTGRADRDGVVVELAVAWGRGEGQALGWTNGRRTAGSHVAGLLDGLAGTEEAGRVALVSVRLAEPALAGQRGECLADPRVRALVRDAALSARA